ncbi:hypothetical protein J437_LFUL011296 [Ladona fulva]|uniref:NADH dehydrogenase [ubiquinone] 1 alpha subcomplex subunit 11 n=1 Tax=Ladona fulva TaxID=123851 RepID=A0A8K0KP15_LADFU|nr:hypothetical protein J437_LFUL011296 [Ladona fulva]
MSYNYYDTPDGEDCFKKLWLSTKYAATIGLAYSTADVLLYSHPKGYYQTVARYAYITGPLVGMAAAFTATTCVATSMRKKDDYLNYILGGCASGSILGAWRKSPHAGFVASILFSGAAVVLKSFVENKWNPFPKIERIYGVVDHHKHDWTIIADRPKGWKTSED